MRFRAIAAAVLLALSFLFPRCAKATLISWQATSVPVLNNSGVWFYQDAQGKQTSHVVVLSLPVALQAGDVLTVTSQCTRSLRADPAQSYPGFAGDVFAMSALFLSAEDPAYQAPDGSHPNVEYDFSGVQLDAGYPQDMWSPNVYGWSTPGQPYQPAINNATYQATAADAGQRYVDLVMWQSSEDAQPIASKWPWLLLEAAAGECRMQVKQER